jgi:LPS-assembly lipoprotein
MWSPEQLPVSRPSERPDRDPAHSPGARVGPGTQGQPGTAQMVPGSRVFGSLALRARVIRPGYAAYSRLARSIAALAIAGLLAGCFQPLYGEHSLTGQPVLREQLSAVDVLQIEAPKGTDEARLAVEIRNALLFDFTGGGYAAPPTHRLKVSMSSTRSSVIVDVHTSRPDIENYGINATYSLTEIATGKIVVTGQTFSRVSYDIPGQQQRFARLRGLRDAESRAAKVIADNIMARLTSYFVAGT